MIKRIWAWIAGVILSTILLAQPASAATFNLRTGNNVPATATQSMPIDSNQCATSGPRAMYVGGIITASGAENTIVASISGLSNGFFLAGGQAASQTIGSLAAGGTAGAYWFIGYGCTVNASTTVTITITSSAGTTTRNIILTAKSSISANAGGNVASSTLGPGAVVGQTIYFDTVYDFGGSDIGDEFMFQPSGGQNFNAGCFRLVGTQVMASNITPVAVGTLNQLYFVQTQKQSGNGYTATIRYFFEYQCANTNTTARPYALQTSGNALKYTGNFDGSGSISVSFPGATNPFTISKSANISSAACCSTNTIIYTITVNNPSAYASRIAQFVDTLPAGAVYVGLHASSNVTAANSSSVPSAGATGTLTFSGRQDQSYLIPAGGSVSLVYTVTIPGVQGSYANNAQAYFGTATTAVGSTTFTVTAPPPLTTVKASFVYSDPVVGTGNPGLNIYPKAIPGADIVYTIVVANPNSFAIDNNSVVITDPTPANLSLFTTTPQPGYSGPVIFQNGSPSSGLTYTFQSLGSVTDDVEFSNDGGTSWSYTPVPNAGSDDPNVTHIRIKPKGAMAANSSFTLSIGYLLR